MLGFFLLSAFYRYNPSSMHKISMRKLKWKTFGKIWQATSAPLLCSIGRGALRSLQLQTLPFLWFKLESPCEKKHCSQGRPHGGAGTPPRNSGGSSSPKAQHLHPVFGVRPEMLDQFRVLPVPGESRNFMIFLYTEIWLGFFQCTWLPGLPKKSV